MSNFLEYEGKSIEDALEKAGRALKIPKDKIQYTVISYGSTGIFGLVGVKKAKIRVKPPQEKKDAQKASVLSLVDEAFGATEKKKSAPSKQKTEKKKSSPEPEKKPAAQEKKQVTPDAAPDKDEEAKSSKASSRRKAPKKPKASRNEKETKPAQEKGGEPEELPEKALPEEETFAEASASESEPIEVEDSMQEEFLPLDASDEDEDIPLVEASPEMVELGKEALEKILSYIGEDVQIEAEIAGGRILYNLKSPNAAIMIGKRGQTLEAIQYIVDKIVNRDKEGRVRIQLDVEGYIETRKAQLRQLALKQAEKARKTGKPATIGQMSAHDRRIIHLALKDDRTVRTQSVGEGFYRRLVIFPKKNGKKRGPQRGEN